MSSRAFVNGPAKARTFAASVMLLGGIWLATDLAAQDPAKDPPPAKRPRVEVEEADAKAKAAKSGRSEDEATPTSKEKAKAKKGKRLEKEEASPSQSKVIHTDDEDAPVKALPGNTSTDTSDLATLLKRTKDRYLRGLYLEVVVPHDIFSSQTGGREDVVAPIPYYLGEDLKRHWPKGDFKIQRLTPQGKPDGKPFGPTESSVRSVIHYEQIAKNAVDDFLHIEDRLSDRDKLPRSEQLAAAEAVLTSAIRFHESSKASGVRKGEAWEEGAEKPLKKQLLDIRLEQLKQLADNGQWDAAFKLTGVLAVDYRDPADQRRIAKPLTDLLEGSFKSGVESEEGMRLALRRLRDLEDQFPDKKVLQPISDSLHRHATWLKDQADKLLEDKQPERALEAISQAVELWPDNKDLREKQSKLMREHRILRVGVRTLPEFMSPALAATDSERRAVELMFESLVKFGVDGNGNARFVPGLAEGLPQVESLARRFVLPRNAYWSNAQPLNANDFRATVKWLKEGTGSRLSPAWGQLLDDVQVVGDPYRLRIPLRQGYIEPLSPMTFKVLPSGQDIDSPEFAQSPISSGPFRFDDKTISDAGRRCVNFIFNPFYGARQGKEGLPRIREVRFFAYKKYDPESGKPAEEFERPNTSAPLDLILDLTAEHAAALALNASASNIKVCRPGNGHSPTRRVYFLAVNQRRQVLASDKVRRGLAHAINREKILNDFFRPKTDAGKTSILGPLHAALNGPYPAGSWACDPKVGLPKIPGSLDLFDVFAASAFYKQGTLGTNLGTAIPLKYADDDPTLKLAMEEICKQFATLPFKAEATPVNARQLRTDLETGNYDLAYWHYDFPDETYSIGPLLETRSPLDGMNIFRSPEGKIEALLQEARTHRNFAEVKKDTWKIHDELNLAMPFIPLWQLDPLSAMHKSVEAPPFDPLLVFSEIERWRAGER